MKNPIQFKVASQPGNPEAYEECEQFIKTMQKIMRLEDWDIKLCFISQAEMAEKIGPDAVFCTGVRDNDNKITIWANCEHERIKEETEWCIIHELIEAVLWYYDEYIGNMCADEKEKKMLSEWKERIINKLARAIWNAMQHKEAEPLDDL